VDLIILGLQLTMLAVTASTAPPEVVQARPTGSEELDRAERGENPEDEEEEEDVQEGEEVSEADMETRTESGYEHTVISVGVVETIKLLWDSDVPVVRRFR